MNIQEKLSQTRYRLKKKYGKLCASATFIDAEGETPQRYELKYDDGTLFVVHESEYAPYSSVLVADVSSKRLFQALQCLPALVEALDRAMQKRDEDSYLKAANMILDDFLSK